MVTNGLWKPNGLSRVPNFQCNPSPTSKLTETPIEANTGSSGDSSLSGRSSMPPNFLKGLLFDVESEPRRRSLL